MSLGRLLAAGKSWVGGNGTGRYRVNKRVALPKFISPRNPFASDSKPDAPSADEDSSETKPTGATAKADASITAKNALEISIAARAVRLLGEWGQKLNPLPRFSKKPGPVKSAIPRFEKTPVQPELSLDQVKVMRNDLSDADLEIVPVQPPVGSLPAKSDEKLALVGNTWDRLTTRIFGPGQDVV